MKPLLIDLELLTLHHCPCAKPIVGYDLGVTLSINIIHYVLQVSLFLPGSWGGSGLSCKVGPVSVWGLLLPSGGRHGWQQPFFSCDRGGCDGCDMGVG